MKIGIISGSGANEVIAALGVEAKRHEEDRNDMRGVDYIEFEYEGNHVVFVQRHGAHHTRDPARLDPRGIVELLEKELGTDDSERLIIQTSASGSLDTTIKLVDEGGIVVCSDVMRGYGFTTQTFGGENGKELHAVMDGRFSEKARRLALDAIAQVPGTTAYDGGIYVNNQGNQFETRAEIATLYCLLDTPKIRLVYMQNLKCEFEGILFLMERWSSPSLVSSTLAKKEEEVKRAQEIREYIVGTKEIIATYENLAKVLSRKHATVSMNAVRELSLLGEARFRNVVLLSFPVNYGVGLVPDERVDHERTKNAISKATAPYIAPVLRNMIEMARQYIR